MGKTGEIQFILRMAVSFSMAKIPSLTKIVLTPEYSGRLGNGMSYSPTLSPGYEGRLVSDVSEQTEEISTALRIDSSPDETLFATESLVRRASPALSILA